MFRDLNTFLPDDILTKVDRAAMHVSLETRIPLLDHELAAFVWGLPPAYRVRRGRSKWLLRRLLRRHVPPELYERPKRGFEMPIRSWLRGPLREWADEILSSPSLADDELVPVATVRRMWREHVAGERNGTTVCGMCSCSSRGCGSREHPPRGARRSSGRSSRSSRLPVTGSRWRNAGG